jgi:hypothetical protein
MLWKKESLAMRYKYQELAKDEYSQFKLDHPNFVWPSKKSKRDVSLMIDKSSAPPSSISSSPSFLHNESTNEQFSPGSCSSLSQTQTF